MLYQRNDGRLELRKFHTITQFYNSYKKDLTKNQQGEFRIQTTSNNEEINWLVDTGSPRSFISRRAEKHLTKKFGHKIFKTDTNIGEFRCFNNNKIQLDYTILLDLEKGNTTAYNCQILGVPQNTVNLVGRDSLQKLGIELTYTKPGEKTKNIHSIQNNIAKWVFQKYPHLCTRIGRSKYHIANSTFLFFF